MLNLGKASSSVAAMPQDKRAALLPLTSLRFVAAAMIVVHHGLPENALPPAPVSLDQGVSFFFVLSGFILTYSYPSLASWAEVRRFLVYRIARIWPAHAVATFATIFAIHAMPIDFKLVANLAMVHAWVPSWPWYFSYNAVSWSISTEFFFYLLFPFLIINWSHTFWWKLALAAALLLGLMIAARDLHLPEITSVDTPSVHGLLYISPLARLLEFVAGMTTCLAFRWASTKLGAASPWLFTILEAGALVVASWVLATHVIGTALLRVLPSTAVEYVGHADAWPAIVPVIFVFAFQRGLLSQFLSLKACLLLGEASYSLYLVHYLGLHFVSKYLGIIGVPGFVGGGMVAIILAFILWRWVEIPARRAIRKLVLAPRIEPMPIRLETPRAMSRTPSI
jgi:peptidoglycan/LPS O-acetylase OafA/YrhL